MLWNFGFRHHPDLQKKWIEGTAGLGMIANMADERPAVDSVDAMIEEFLSAENPQLLEAIRKAPPGQKKKILKDLERNFEVISKLLAQLKKQGWEEPEGNL